MFVRITISVAIAISIHSVVLQNFWLIKSESGKTAFYLSMNNDGKLQALTGTPNRDFAPSENQLD